MISLKTLFIQGGGCPLTLDVISFIFDFYRSGLRHKVILQLDPLSLCPRHLRKIYVKFID
jgi:hypothetical protein